MRWLRTVRERKRAHKLSVEGLNVRFSATCPANGAKLESDLMTALDELSSWKVGS